MSSCHQLLTALLGKLQLFEPEKSDLQYIALHGAHIEYDDDTHAQGINKYESHG